MCPVLTIIKIINIYNKKFTYTINLYLRRSYFLTISSDMQTIQNLHNWGRLMFWLIKKTGDA